MRVTLLLRAVAAPHKRSWTAPDRSAVEITSETAGTVTVTVHGPIVDSLRCQSVPLKEPLPCGLATLSQVEGVFSAG
jgi:hypothetical protein